MDTATLRLSASRLVRFLSQIAAENDRVPELICLGHEATLVSAAASACMTRPVRIFVPSSSSELASSTRGPIVVIMDGRTWPEGVSRLLQGIEHASGPIIGLAFVHEPDDRTLVDRLSKSGCRSRTLMKTEGRSAPRRLGADLLRIPPGGLDERGMSPAFVTLRDGTVTEVPARPGSSWPALAQLTDIRQATGLHLPAEPEIFRMTTAQPLSRLPELPVSPHVAGSLRRTLLGGADDVQKLAVELKRSLLESAALGIAVYARGRQVSCRVCLNARDAESLARAIQVVRTEVQQSGVLRSQPFPPVVVLLSVLGASHVTSTADVTAGRVSLSTHTLVTRNGAGPAVILAHVPCFMNWTGRETLAALEKKAASRTTQLWASRTRTFWVGDAGTVEECTGGLPNRRRSLRTAQEVAEEINLVARHLSEQLDGSHYIATVYYPGADIAVLEGSHARKAIALSALLRVETQGLETAIDKAECALAALAYSGSEATTVENSAGYLLEQSHILLAMALSPRRSACDPVLLQYIEQIQRGLDPAGRVLADLPPSAPEQPYLAGVVLTALATCQSRLGIPAIRPSQLQSSLTFARGQFGKYPRWPEVWWQLRAWSAIYMFWPEAAVRDFLQMMIQWTGRYQLRSGAFLTWEWPTAPCFQTACVAEGVVQAGHVLAEGESPKSCATMTRMVARALEFCSSLVIDGRHADLFPTAPRAIGGIRSWHGGTALRSDAAGHYLHALFDYSRLLARTQS